MSVQLMTNEELVWKSFPGVRYRSFIFARDFFTFVFSSIIFYYGMSDLLPGLFSDKVLLYISWGISIIGLIFSSFNQIQFLLIKYYITTERLIIMKGFFNRKLTSIKLEHIHDTKVIQSFSERLIKTGSIYVFTANDSNGSDDENNFLNRVPSIKNIDDPFVIHRKLEEMLELNAH